MKSTNKFNLGFSIFILTILFAGLNSCSKSGKSIASIEKQLIGSVWETHDNSNNDVTTITFVSATAYTYVVKDLPGGTIAYSESGTYKYDPPSITITSSGVSETGTITGNKMEFPDEEFPFFKK